MSKDKIAYRYKPTHLAPDEFIAGMPKRDILESDLANGTISPTALRDATAPNPRTGKPAYEAVDEAERKAQLAAIDAGVQVAQVVDPRADTFTIPITTHTETVPTETPGPKNV